MIFVVRRFIPFFILLIILHSYGSHGPFGSWVCHDLPVQHGDLSSLLRSKTRRYNGDIMGYISNFLQTVDYLVVFRLFAYPFNSCIPIQ